jgi:tetratricopeptide (TPR) repeat protein
MHSFPKVKVEILSLLILSLIIAAAYIPTFSGEFILDDRPLVKDNRFIREFSRPTFYLSHEDGVSSESFPGYHTGYYRPLINLLYTLDYKTWGMNPSGFRITNLILHLFACIILYQILFVLLGGRFIAFAVTVLFGLHPVNTEAVAWIVNRNNILVSLFSLISFYYYLKNAKEGKIWARLLSYLCFMVALFCKEFAIMLLPILFLYNRLILRDGKVNREEILGYIPFILILFLYFLLRANAIGSVVTPISTPNLWKNTYFAPFLIAYDLKLIVIPYGLHSFIIHYPDDYLSWQAFAGFVCLGFLAFVAWRERKNKILLFSFLSFLIALFPVLNIIPTSAVTVVSMRWLYFPMIFLSFSWASYLQRLLNVNRFFVLSGLSALIIYFGIYSYTLNQNLWHDEDTFFRQEIQNFNNNFYAGGLAEKLLDNKKYREAERYFQMAINNYPCNAINYINYSALLIDTGRPDDALLYLSKAKSLTMNHNKRGQWFNNMGMAYFNLGKNEEALRNFKEAIIFGPNEPQFWANLGAAYGSIGDYENSLFVLQKGLNIGPDSIPLRKNLAVTYLRMGNPAMASSVLEKIPPRQRAEQGVIELLNEAYSALESNSPTGDN